MSLAQHQRHLGLGAAAMRSLHLGIFVALTGMACTAAENPVTPPQRSLVARQVLLRGPALTIRDHFKRLSQQEPGFTGVFLDSAGDLVIVVARDDFPAQSLARIVAWAHSLPGVANGKTTAKLRRVKYDYETLLESSGVVYGTLRPDDHFIASAIDETRGVIILGFTSLSSAESIRARLAKTDIPLDMVEFEQRSQAKPDVTLNGVVRPIMGGVEVHGHNAIGSCTLGFNVMRWDTGIDWSTSPQYFLTAGHCGETWGTKGLFWYQPSGGLASIIGDEFEVLPKHLYPYCPAAHSPCMDADVLVVKYDSTKTVPDSVLYGNVANVDAFKNVIGHFNVQGSVAGGLKGQTVTVVGMESGKHTGVITRSCEDQLVRDPNPGRPSVWILCQQQANYPSMNGDSGAPVFIPYNGQFGTPAIVGVHSNSDQTGHVWFSPIGQIDWGLHSAYYYQ